MANTTVMTPSVISTLETCFAMSFTDEESCLVAKICMATLYNYQKEHPEFLERKRLLKTTPSTEAKAVWVKKIQSWDFTASVEWLKRKNKDEFSEKTVQEVEIIDNNPAMESVLELERLEALKNS